MNEALRALVEGKAAAAGLHYVREYLQARILAGLQRAGAMVPLAFQGDTALRFLYALPRFSEDLDFASVEGGVPDLERALRRLRHDLQHDDLTSEIMINERTAVHKAQVRFHGLAYSLGLSPHPNQVLMIRLDVDTRPPAGAGLETSIVRRHELLHLQHHDKASLLAGKLHAVLQRVHPKGRDYYDLIWYLSDRRWPGPNLVLLNNALIQTGFKGGPLTDKTWRDALLEKSAAVDWNAVRGDVLPFLERPSDADLVRRDVFEKAVGGAAER